MKDPGEAAEQIYHAEPTGHAKTLRQKDRFRTILRRGRLSSGHQRGNRRHDHGIYYVYRSTGNLSGNYGGTVSSVLIVLSFIFR